jgi:hypothetical protein
MLHVAHGDLQASFYDVTMAAAAQLSPEDLNGLFTGAGSSSIGNSTNSISDDAFGHPGRWQKLLDGGITPGPRFAMAAFASSFAPAVRDDTVGAE